MRLLHSDTISGHCSLHLWVQVILMTQASQVTGTTGGYHHAQLIFVFLVEMGFHHVGQANLEPKLKAVHMPQPPKVLRLQA